MAFGAKGCWEVASGESKMPAAPTKPEDKEGLALHQLWLLANSTAYFIILGNMESRYQALYELKKPQAAKVWKRLEHDYLDKLSKDIHGLRGRLWSIKLEDCETVEKYSYTIQPTIVKYNGYASSIEAFCPTCIAHQQTTVKKDPDGFDVSNFKNIIGDTDSTDDESVLPISRHEHGFSLLHGLPAAPEWSLCAKLIKTQTNPLSSEPASRYRGSLGDRIRIVKEERPWP
jgi:hypothetical protein